MKRLSNLKNRIFETSDEDCFIEREQILRSLESGETNHNHYYAEVFSELLSRVSVPVLEDDVFVGRVVEGKMDIPGPSAVLYSVGHLTPDYNTLLTKGYKGVLEEIRKNAADLGTEHAAIFRENAEIVIGAVRDFAQRYSQAAKEAGNMRAYEALRRVPYEGAYDLYSALQSIWIVHMIAGCYIGARDYAFGYMDKYLYPFYLDAKEKGVTDEEIRYMLAAFLIKPNEICGRCTHNYKTKPVRSQASKQYLLLGGKKPNRLSELFLEAAAENCLAQPEITVVLSMDSSEAFQLAVAEAMAVLTDKLQVYHYDLLKNYLQQKNMPEDIAARPSFSACCTFDLSYHSIRDEFYIPTVKIFCDTLFEREYQSIEELKACYSKNITACVTQYVQATRDRLWGAKRPSQSYLLDALLNPDCVQNCDYPPAGLRYVVKNMFLPGIATLGNSLHVLDQMVFLDKRISYAEFIHCLKQDYAGYETLRKEILSLGKFGNDLDSDTYTAEMGELLVHSVNQAEHTEREILIPAFYSLERDNTGVADIPATPDGRKAGTPFSENQSPTYGTDKTGITALLNSLAKLPFGGTAAGGLNLTFSSSIKGAILLPLIKTYFENGGLHIGITVLDKSVLQDAMIHPERYKSLTVRLYGFSEYFVSLPQWQQLAVMQRTEY